MKYFDEFASNTSVGSGNQKFFAMKTFKQDEFYSYDPWDSKLKERLGEAYMYWNLSLEFGRANDAASDDAWLI